MNHKSRGTTSNRSHNEGIGKYAVELVKGKYADFGLTLATEVLLDKHQFLVGKETLRRWKMAEGLWLSRTQRRTFHQPRLRRESDGELIQIDGSDHRWSEQRGDACTLLVFIDDATSKLIQLRFVPSESTDSSFEALRRYLETHGCPVAFYSDKHTVLRAYRPDAKGGQAITQCTNVMKFNIPNGPPFYENAGGCGEGTRSPSFISACLRGRFSASEDARIDTNNAETLGQRLSTDVTKSAVLDFPARNEQQNSPLPKFSKAPAIQEAKQP